MEFVKPPNTSVPFGMLRLARIIRYDLKNGRAIIKLAHTGTKVIPSPDISISIPNSYSSNNGIFAGGLVDINTPIIVGRAEGGEYYFISFLIDHPKNLPDIPSGSYLISCNKSTKISLDIKNNINIGSNIDKIHIDTKRSLLSTSIDNKFSFTEASRNIDGIIKRDILPPDFYSSTLKLKSDDYDQYLIPIGLDPSASICNTFSFSIKNPEFVEKRELIYEFAASSNVQNDIIESSYYDKSIVKIDPVSDSISDRRDSRSDTLSLGLEAPNFLIETIKGTVVDIFGNILDINRTPILIGNEGSDLTLKSDNGNIKSDIFNKIKAAERKSIAFHFELNARKDLTGNNNQIILPDINSNIDYSRNRSRFFLDIDKEGLFKLNVPATSETGNIPLLVRYENSTTKDIINPTGNNNIDIFQDSFAPFINENAIDLKSIDGYATPIDRLRKSNLKERTPYHIQYSTPYHSITNSLYMFKDPIASQFLDYQYNKHVELSTISKSPDFNIVSPIINVSGANANAGGRSGSMNFDGSLDVSIGANTIDRQSLWLDTAGGIIANVGRDKKDISAAVSLDGDLLVQIGGATIDADSRFNGTVNKDNKLSNGNRGGTLDIRVFNDGNTVTIIRVDKDGITIATPGTLALKGRKVTISAEDSIIIDADNISFHGRAVDKYKAGDL